MSGMFVVIVAIDARPDTIDEFTAGLHANAVATRAEPGCLRFDILRAHGEPNRFILYEIYTDEDAFFTGHRQAAHYPAWVELCDRCVEPDGRRNTYATPAYPEEIAEHV